MNEGQAMPKGLDIKWKPIGAITYAMPLDKFLEGAIIIKREGIAHEVPTADVHQQENHAARRVRRNP